MHVDQILKRARSALGADRVYGTPIERDGVTVVPAAKVVGGGGGGGDESKDGGGGGGFGVNARPAGVLIIEPDGTVKWKGFIDINRVILGGQIVGICFFVFAWLTERSKARAAMKATIAAAAIERVGRRRTA
ncbi:MAG: spore germination protein GerW family protein [Ilumatobacteraceae bacterium]